MRPLIARILGSARWLHSQAATRLKAALLFRPNTIVIDVPYHYHDTADLARPRGM